MMLVGLSAAPARAQGESETTVGTPSGPITIEKAIPYVSGGDIGQTLDVYRPAADVSGRPGLVMVHGGGWVGGGADDMSRQATLAARQGWIVFNINYRGTSTLGTNGEAWPTEVEDVKSALSWVHDNATNYGADADNLAVLGASAGGNLTAVAAAEGLPGVRAIALWSAPADLAALVPNGDQPPDACGDDKECREFWVFPWVTQYLGCQPDACADTYRAASPVHVVGRSTPPTWLANSTDEIVPLDQARALDTALQRAGVRHELRVVDGDQHAYGYTADVWNEMMPWLADQLGVPHPTPVDFSSSPLDIDAPLLVMLGIAVILLVMLVAVAISRQRHDSRKPVL
jgi:acetyl esterase/lipase